MKRIIKLVAIMLMIVPFHALQAKADTNEEITLTVSADGPTKDEALKNALRTAIEQAYGAFVSANTTILNDELVRDEIVIVSNGSIKEYKEISSYEKADGKGYMMTVNATVSLPHLITYAKNHGSECEFAGNTFGMELKLFKLQKENELKALYNALPEIENIAKNTMTWELTVSEPRIVDVNYTVEPRKWQRHPEIVSNMVELQTSKVESSKSSDHRDYFSLHIDSDLSKLFNDTISMSDGYRDFVKNNTMLHLLDEMPNGQYASVKFNLDWVSKDTENEVANYIKSLIESIGLDYRTYSKNVDQGLGGAYVNNDLISVNGGDREYIDNGYLRNSQEDIAKWTDALYDVLNKVKNNFVIVDNTGQVSDFDPFTFSEIQFEDAGRITNSYAYAQYLESRDGYYYNREQFIRHKEYEFKYGNYKYRNGSDLKDWLYRTKCFSLENNQRIFHDIDKHLWASIGGTGLFRNISIIQTKSKRFSPMDWRIDWEAYVFIPISEIERYSSFKVVPRN